MKTLLFNVITLTLTLMVILAVGVESFGLNARSADPAQDPQNYEPQKADVGEQVNAQDPAQQPSTLPANAKFTAEQLEQLVAPIALHPDSLLSQIFMAATYPLEVVEAERWLKRYPQLTGTDLEAALKDQRWDPSVKSLCGVPTVLQQMSENLDWTQDLGDAFLGQQTELMDAVQRMRQEALDAGTLETTAQQAVTTDDRIIVIESANPEVVYVPTYSPVVVYGGWHYPYWYYPAFYYPPAPGHGYLGFSVGFYWGWGFWGHCDWHHHVCGVDAHRYNRFNQRTCNDPVVRRVGAFPGQVVPWTHDPEHRRGVNYRAPQIANRFGAAPGVSRLSRDQARGLTRTSPLRGSPEPASSAIRPGRRDTTPPLTGPKRTRPGDRATPRPGSQPAPAPVPRTRRPGDSSLGTPHSSSSSVLERELRSRADSDLGGVLSGSRKASFDRSASARGAISRGLPSDGLSVGGLSSSGSLGRNGLGRGMSRGPRH